MPGSEEARRRAYRGPPIPPPKRQDQPPGSRRARTEPLAVAKRLGPAAAGSSQPHVGGLQSSWILAFHVQLCIAVCRSELGQQLELLPLRPQQLLEVLAEDPVQLLMQLDDLDLGLQIDLIIQAGGQTVPRRLAVLGHQDDRSLQGRQHGKDEVEEDIGVGIEWFDLPCPDDAVESGPGDQRDETQSYERPGPAK